MPALRIHAKAQGSLRTESGVCTPSAVRPWATGDHPRRPPTADSVFSRAWLLPLVACLLSTPGAFGQSSLIDTPPDPARPTRILPSQVPNMLRRNVRVLGDRISVEGKERMVLAGQVTDGQGQKAAGQIVYELPGMVRLDQAGADARVLRFDGAGLSRDAGDLSTADRGLLEALAYDTPEAFLDAPRTGGALRFLGSGFRADDGTAENYKGPWFDVYELSVTVRTADRPERRQKHFWFDSLTGLLQQVRYRAAGDTAVETQFSWLEVDGQQVPGRIDRTEDGKAVFSFQTSTVTFGPKVDDGAFSAAR